MPLAETQEAAYESDEEGEEAIHLEPSDSQMERQALIDAERVIRNSAAYKKHAQEVNQREVEKVNREITEANRASQKAAMIDAQLMPPPRQPSPKKRKAQKQGKRLVNAKKLLITIARCVEDLEIVAEAFEDKWGICQYKIVSEKHKDGGLHIHAALVFDKIVQCRDNSITINGNPYVINFQRLSKEKGGWKGWLKYLDKDPIRTLDTLVVSNYMGAENKEELFLRLSTDKGEYQAMMSWDRVYGCWVTFHKPTFDWTPVFPADSFNVPNFLQGLKVNLEGKQTRRQIVILIGATRLGKTQMVRTLYHKTGHGYCRGMHNFLEWSGTSGPMILDDLEDGQPGSTTKEPKKGWTDSQPFNMSGKYQRTTTMRARQVIILTNNLPEWIGLDYWKVNCKVINIQGKCWK